MTFHDPKQPLCILLFDDTELYRRPLTQTISDAKIAVHWHHVDTPHTFREALTGVWDLCFVAYPVAQEALALMQQEPSECSCILLYHPEEEAGAFSLINDTVSDLVSLDEMRRLPLILRREWKLKQCQDSALQLHQLEMRFRTIIEGFGDTVLILDAERTIQYANSAFERLFHYRILEILGKPFATLLHPAEKAAIQRIGERLYQCVGAMHTTAHRIQRAAGEWAHVETTAHSLHDPAGQVILVLHVRDISKRKRAEQALVESERRLRLFVEHAPAAIAMFDREMHYLAVSRRWLSDYRLEDQSLVGRSHYDVFPDLPERWREIHQHCLQGAVEKSEADPFPRADGTFDWVRWEMRPWHDSQGNIGGLILFSEVITARIEAELTLQQNEARLRQAQSIAQLGSWTLDLDSGTVVWSDEFFRICGLDPSSTQASLELVFLLVHPEDRDRAAEAVARAQRTGEPYHIEVRIVRPDGEIRWVDSQVEVLWNEQPQPRMLIGTFFDITDRKLTQEVLEQRVTERTTALQREKERVEAILNHSPDSILLIDPDLHIRQANLAFRRLFGYTAEEEVSPSLSDLIYQPDAGIAAGLTTSITNEQVEIRAVRKDGTLINVELSVSALSDDGFVCVIRDITERKIWERQLRFQAGMQKIVSAAVIVTDMQSCIQSWNEGAERIYGWSAAEAIGKFTTEILQTQITADERARNIAQLTEQGWWQWEFVQRRRDGTFCYVLSSAAVMYDDQGAAIGLVAVNHDITERKEAEDALQKSAAEIQDLYNNAPCGYHSLDQNGLIVQINDTELAWLGYQREEVVGKLNFADIVTPEGLQTFQEQFPLFQVRGWVKDLEYTLIAKDGTTRPILLSSTVVYDDLGQYVQSRSTLFDMTDLRQAQTAIVESEARYRLLAENVTDVITKVNADWIRTFVTPSCYTLLGYTPDELVGRSIFDLIHPDDRHATQATITGAINALQPSFTLAQRLCHKAGHSVWVEIIGSIIREPDTESLVEIIAVMRDITARRAAEAALRESEARYRLLAETVFDMVSRNNLQGDFLYVSPSTERLLGYRPEELIGQSGYRVIHPEQQAQMGELLQRATQTRAQQPFQLFQVRHKAGYYIVAEISVRAIFSEETGEVLEFMSAARDVTEQKRAEEALRASEEKFRQVAENFDHLLFIRAADNHRMLYVNSAAERLTGIPDEQIYANPRVLLERVHPGDVAYVNEQLRLQRYFEEGTLDLEYRFMKPDGEVRWFRVRTFPIREESGVIVSRVGTCEDITERKQAEMALRQALTKEQELSELKSRFVSIASHEFRTPLATISATTETLLSYRDRLDASQLDARLYKILTHVDHMKEIMEDVLQLARIQAGRVVFDVEQGDLDSLCREVIEEFRSQPEYTARIRYHCACSPVPLAFDLRLMQHVVSNLIANGLKYSPNEQPIAVELRQATETVTLQVSDQGIGIPAADLEHIFEPFHRAGNVGTIAGTGLGLSITKEAVEMHGGTIQINSQIDTGTTVTVMLPKDAERMTNHAENSDHR